jgi:hypothetical protein
LRKEIIDISHPDARSISSWVDLIPVLSGGHVLLGLILAGPVTGLVSSLRDNLRSK